MTEYMPKMHEETVRERVQETAEEMIHKAVDEVQFWDQVIPLTVSMLIPLVFLAATYVSARQDSKAWYNHKLDKPKLAPPLGLATGVWVTLFGLIGYSSYRIFILDRLQHPLPLSLYALQLLLNFTCLQLLFQRRLVGLAALDSVLLVMTAASTTWAFSKIDQTAAMLMVPYTAWVAFDTVIHVLTWRMNPNYSKVDPKIIKAS